MPYCAKERDRKGGLRSRYNQLHIFAVTAMCGLTTGFMVICLHELRTRFQVLYQGSDTDNNDNDFDGLKGVDGVLGRDLKRQFELFGANVRNTFGIRCANLSYLAGAFTNL